MIHVLPVRRLAAAALVGGLSVVSFTACSGGDDPVTQNKDLDDDGNGEVSADEVMTAAKAELDATSGVHVSLSTDDHPDGNDDYLASATGTLIADPPSFDGEVGGRVMGVEASDIPVISADGELYVEVPVLGWQAVDPGDFCAPDPGTLLDPDTGVSPILTATEDLEAGDSELGGEDNKETITPFTGTLPGDTVRNILPCAEGDEFDATYRIDSDGRLVQAEITGEFFPGMDAITYAIDIDDYDVEQEISAPE